MPVLSGAQLVYSLLYAHIGFFNDAAVRLF